MGISTGLNYYSNYLYRNLTQKHYGSTLGECIRIGVDSLLYNTNFGYIDVVVSGEQMLLNGDPAVKINPHSKPDYDIEPSLISLNPAVINLESGNTFNVNFSVENIGENKNDSINIVIFRYYPKSDITLSANATLVKTMRIKAPAYRSSFSVPVLLNPNNSLGANRIQIVVDAANEVNEICETNNTANIDFNISSLDLLPVYPTQFAIVAATDTAGFALKSSTVEPFAPARLYFAQFDTTQKFNSPLLQTTTINQTGGVVSWRPHVAWINNRVYYWRVAVDTIYGNHSLTWHNTSFTYITSSSPGWDQSHFYEFNKDYFQTLFIDSVSRKFKFANNVRNVKIHDFGGGTDPTVMPFLDYQSLCNGGSCVPYIGIYTGLAGQPFGGFNVVCFDSILGQPIQNGYGINPQQGDYDCGRQQIPVFQYLTTGYIQAGDWRAQSYETAPDANTQRSYLNNFLNNFIPNGAYVLMYSIGNFMPQTMGTALHSTIHNLFHTAILDTMTASRTYILFGKKGAHGFATKEVQSPIFQGLIDTTFHFSGNWYNGSITSTQIGPVSSWTSMHWSYAPQETPSADSTTIQLIGVDNLGNQTVIYQNNSNQTFDYNINWVNATQYPYLMMRMITKDSLHRTPAQLNYWRINYQPLPELALDKHSAYYLSADTLGQGDKMNFKIAIRNVSPVKMDTSYFKYSILKSNNLKDSFYIKMRPINPWDTAMLSITVPTLYYPGKNALLMDDNSFDINPKNKHKNEIYHFNNIARFNFLVNSDKTNPLLDVAFDGQHIMNGDIVSAKPHITIKLKDENKYLAIDSLGLMQFSLKLPGLSGYNTLTPANTAMKFTPATNPAVDNTATVELDPVLAQDGTYTLRVQGHDKSNNVSASLDYLISFQIINKPMISDVLNYPNPFTTLTHFVFTLTGSEIPTYFKIQIFTITGKVVREINIAQLGEGMHIGKNMTQYAWDGTDEYGKALANGLYLYRVVTNLSGNKIDHYTTSIDKYFKSGFGKMYLMR